MFCCAGSQGRWETCVRLPRRRLLMVNFLLLGTLALARWGQPVGPAAREHGNFLASLPLPYHGWTASDLKLTADDLALLEPEAFVVRNYRSSTGQTIQLAVVAGREKRTVHTPAFCMTGSGWETVIQRPVVLEADGHDIPAVQSTLAQNGAYVLTTYFFTDGNYCSDDLLRFQALELMGRLRGREPLGALVRIITPYGRSPNSAQALTRNFAQTVLPSVLAGLRARQHRRITP